MAIYCLETKLVSIFGGAVVEIFLLPPLVEKEQWLSFRVRGFRFGKPFCGNSYYPMGGMGWYIATPSSKVGPISRRTTHT